MVGVILGALARVPNPQPSALPLGLTVVVGVGAQLGGVGVKLVLSNDACDLDGWSSTLSCWLAFVPIGLLKGRVGRRAG